MTLAPEQWRRQNRALYADTTSDSEGRFTVRGIAPGEYKVFAWEQPIWLGARQNPAFIANYHSCKTWLATSESASRCRTISGSGFRHLQRMTCGPGQKPYLHPNSSVSVLPLTNLESTQNWPAWTLRGTRGNTAAAIRLTNYFPAQN